MNYLDPNLPANQKKENFVEIVTPKIKSTMSPEEKNEN